MAIGGHEFDAVEAGLLCVESSGTVLLDDPGNLGRFQRPVRRRLRKAVRSDNEDARVCPIGRIHRRGDRLLPGHGDMGRAASMPELGEHVAALGMHRVCDALPACDLLVAINPRSAPVSPRRRRDGGRLREDEPAIRSTLAIVLQHQVARHAARPLGTETAQGRHHDAMLERDRPDLHGGEELVASKRNHFDSPWGSGQRRRTRCRQTRPVSLCPG
jgi:hypothetical protein